MRTQEVLNRCVAALGGTLNLIPDFGDEQLKRRKEEQLKRRKDEQLKVA